MHEEEALALCASIGGAAEDSADRVERAALAIGAAVDALIIKIGDKALVKGLIQFLELAAPFLKLSAKFAAPGIEDTFRELLAEREAILALEQESQARIRETQQQTDVATLITEVARVRSEIDALNVRIEEAEALRAEVTGTSWRTSTGSSGSTGCG